MQYIKIPFVCFTVGAGAGDVDNIDDIEFKNVGGRDEVIGGRDEVIGGCDEVIGGCDEVIGGRDEVVGRDDIGEHDNVCSCGCCGGCDCDTCKYGGGAASYLILINK